MIKIHSLECGPVLTNTYLLYNDTEKTCLVFDVPPDSLAGIQNFLVEHQLSVKAILLTHTHWDHTVDCADLAESTGAPVFVHKDDDYRLTNPMEHTVWPLPFIIKPVQATGFVEHGQKLSFHESFPELEVRHTPGHTEGGVCFVDHDNKLVLAGDTIFHESVGRTDLPGGNMATLLNSICEQILSLPDDYQVFPGHGPTTTIGHERQFNPFIEQA